MKKMCCSSFQGWNGRSYRKHFYFPTWRHTRFQKEKVAFGGGGEESHNQGPLTSQLPPRQGQERHIPPVMIFFSSSFCVIVRCGNEDATLDLKPVKYGLIVFLTACLLSSAAPLWAVSRSEWPAGCAGFLWDLSYGTRM